jgi:preprotein translocase subunit SecF
MRLRFIPDNISINFMRVKNINFVISLILILLSFAFVMFKGMNFGIDFSGGIIIEAKLNKVPDLALIRSDLSKLDIGDISVQDFDRNNIMIKVGSKSSDQKSQDKVISAIKELLNIKFDNNIEYRRIDYVGPQVGSELIEKGI